MLVISTKITKQYYDTMVVNGTIMEHNNRMIMEWLQDPFLCGYVNHPCGWPDVLAWCSLKYPQNAGKIWSDFFGTEGFVWSCGDSGDYHRNLWEKKHESDDYMGGMVQWSLLLGSLAEACPGKHRNYHMVIDVDFYGKTTWLLCQQTMGWLWDSWNLERKKLRDESGMTMVIYGEYLWDYYVGRMMGICVCARVWK